MSVVSGMQACWIDPETVSGGLHGRVSPLA